MSTTPTEPTAVAPAADPKPVEAPKPTPPAEPRTFTQAELDQMVEKRFAKYRDYDDLKAKADEYDKAQEAAKSELQKATERAAKAEADALIAKREAFAATKGVLPSMVSGSTPEEWEASATAALEWKGKQAEQPATPPATPTVHAAGNNGPAAGTPGDIDAQIAEAEKKRDFVTAIALKQQRAAAAKTT
ncbi:MAG TPA: hypothetical protein PKD84_13535 [Propionicimonas sp.]|nr:hypothetical protein [Propionicimonas sp.]